MLLMLSAPFPVFVSDTVCPLLMVPSICEGNVKEAGERVAAGPEPDPVRPTVWMAGLALSVMVTVPVLDPLALGLKVTLTLHEAPASTLEPQLLVWEKSPLIAMLVMVSVAVPVLVRVKLCELLLVPTASEANVREAGEKLTAGPPVPVPVRQTV